MSLVNSKDNKNAGSYADQVAKWQAAGYDVRAQDMGDQYGEGNIAVRRAGGKGSYGEQPAAQTEGKPASIGGGTGGGEQGEQLLTLRNSKIITPQILTNHSTRKAEPLTTVAI